MPRLNLDQLAHKALALKLFGISFRDFNRDYLATRADRRRTLRLAAAVALTLGLLLLASTLCSPSVDQAIGWTP